jgi:hypothetical protein
MSTALGVVFLLGGVGCGVLTFYWYLLTMWDWLGSPLGIIAAFVVAPGAVVFPLVYWLVQGSFPIHYVTVWAVASACSALAGTLLTRR